MEIWRCGDLKIRCGRPEIFISEDAEMRCDYEMRSGDVEKCPSIKNTPIFSFEFYSQTASPNVPQHFEGWLILRILDSSSSTARQTQLMIRTRFQVNPSDL